MKTQANIGKLEATHRTRSGKENSNKLRAQGLIPAVLYGGKNEAVSLTLNPTALTRAIDPSAGRNTLFDLTLTSNGKKENLNVMLKDFQIDSIKQTIIHVDLVRVDLNKPVRVSVPLIVEGQPEGVKVGGVLHQVLRTLQVECTPNKIPSSLSVDATALQIGDGIQVSTLKTPEGVTLVTPGHVTCVQVVQPRKVVEEAEVAAAEGVLAEGEAAEATAEGQEAKPGSADEKKESKDSKKEAKDSKKEAKDSKKEGKEDRSAPRK